MRKLPLVLLLISLLSISCVTLETFLTGEVGNFIHVVSDDSEMNTAIQRARDTLPLFIAEFQDPQPDQTEFSLKVRFPYDDGENWEHLWVSDLTYSEGGFTGLVWNEPLRVRNLHLGDEVRVDPADISDWIIIEDGKMLGGFTIYAIRDKLPEHKREEFESEIGFIMGEEPVLP
jgi:uncharacterized protein YegJ (DUF2314 family)